MAPPGKIQKTPPETEDEFAWVTHRLSMGDYHNSRWFQRFQRFQGFQRCRSFQGCLIMPLSAPVLIRTLVNHEGTKNAKTHEDNSVQEIASCVLRDLRVFVVKQGIGLAEWPLKAAGEVMLR
jgi:hypothetical protein